MVFSERALVVSGMLVVSAGMSAAFPGCSGSSSGLFSSFSYRIKFRKFARTVRVSLLRVLAKQMRPLPFAKVIEKTTLGLVGNGIGVPGHLEISVW